MKVDEDGNLSKTEYYSDENTLFSITEINSQTKFLGNAKAVQINCGNYYLSRGNLLESSADTFGVQITEDKMQAMSFIINRFIGDGVDGGDSKYQSASASSNSVEPYDVYSGLAGRRYLRYFKDILTVPKNDLIETIFPNVPKSYGIDFFAGFIDKVNYFVNGFPISSHKVQLGIDKADNNVRI